jgi:hypothetical protein
MIPFVVNGRSWNVLGGIKEWIGFPTLGSHQIYKS